MVEQDDRFPGAVAAQSRKEIAATGRRFDDSRLDAFTIENFFEEMRRLDFVAGRIGCVDLDLAAKRGHRVVFQAPPAEIARPSADGAWRQK